MIDTSLRKAVISTIYFKSAELDTAFGASKHKQFYPYQAAILCGQPNRSGGAA